jgi:hypothetical protein
MKNEKEKFFCGKIENGDDVGFSDPTSYMLHATSYIAVM